MSYILLAFGGAMLLLGLFYYILYYRNSAYEGYKSVTGCIIEYLNEKDDIQVENIEFGEEVIKNKDEDTFNPLEFNNTIYAIEVEYVIKNKKYHLRTKPLDSNSIEIGDTVVVRYNAKNPAKAYITTKFGGYPLLVVGSFLLVLGMILKLL